MPAIKVLERRTIVSLATIAAIGIGAGAALGARHGPTIEKVDFALLFATTQAEVDRLSAMVGGRLQGDAILWFAYPKGTSKKYRCEFNRDSGWSVLRGRGFDTVRQVAIDEDWSALRFRRLEYIKR